MAYEPTQLAFFETIHPKMGWDECNDFGDAWLAFNQRTLGYRSSMVRSDDSNKKKAWRKYGGSFLSLWRGADGWLVRLTFKPLRWIRNTVLGSASALLVLFPCSTASVQVSTQPLTPSTPAAIERQATIKRVYTELAPRLFEQVDPPQIKLLSETIVDECKKTGIDPLFVLAVIEVESNFDVEAVSGAGARGLMQIMPATFKGVSKSKRMLDPVENVKAGITYISLLYSQGFKTPEKLLHAYNQGPGNALAVFRGEMETPIETRVHIPKVMQTYYRLLAQDGVPKKDASKRFLVAQK